MYRLPFLEVSKKLLFFDCRVTSKIMFVRLCVYVFLQEREFLPSDSWKHQFSSPEEQCKKILEDFDRGNTVCFSLSDNWFPLISLFLRRK